MNWGNGIILVFVVFFGLMAALVTICMKQDDLHLVTKNYYEEEIKYQDHIDKVNNTSLYKKEAMAYDGKNLRLDLNLPLGATGELHLFRPSDARMDRKFNLAIQEEKTNTFDLKSLPPGYWKVKLSWTVNGVGFYEEKKIER
ncbi:MAG: FixH family protein [Cyclobacteriaceae bacterium]